MYFDHLSVDPKRFLLQLSKERTRERNILLCVSAFSYKKISTGYLIVGSEWRVNKENGKYEMCFEILSSEKQY